MRNKLLKFPFPLFVAIIYVFIGVLFHLWHPTWIIFLTIPAYYNIVLLMDKDGKNMTTAQILKLVPVPSIVIIFYLILGFALHLWHPGWLVFLLIPLYYAMIPMFSKK